jgi:hypothetical protein
MFRLPKSFLFQNSVCVSCLSEFHGPTITSSICQSGIFSEAYSHLDLFFCYLTMQYKMKFMNRRIVGRLWMMNWMESVGKRSWFILLYYPNIFLQTNQLNVYIKVVKYSLSCLSINGFDFTTCTGAISVYLWLYSPLLDLGRFFSFLILYTVGRSPWTGDQAVTGQHKHRINAHRHPCLKWDSSPRFQCWEGEDSSCLRPLGLWSAPVLYETVISVLAFDIAVWTSEMTPHLFWSIIGLICMNTEPTCDKSRKLLLWTSFSHCRDPHVSTKELQETKKKNEQYVC